MITLLHGDAVEQLSTLAAASVQTCVTSPPYWRLRRYTSDPREIGQEATYQEYIMALSDVFDEVWRVLADDGTLWVNLGDAYARTGGTDRKPSASARVGSTRRTLDQMPNRNQRAPDDLPPKSLIGLPWRVAFALQDRGWVLRSEIIWEKPNGMCESVEDRPTRTHEQVFLFTKQGRYYYDQKAIAEPLATSSVQRINQKTFHQQEGGPKDYGKTGINPNRSMRKAIENFAKNNDGTRNARTIWRINTNGIPDEHYAPYPDELPRRCILAGSRVGDTVLDPFVGSGTTARVAEQLQRNSIGIDLAYQELQQRRTNGVQIEMVELR